MLASPVRTFVSWWHASLPSPQRQRWHNALLVRLGFSVRQGIWYAPADHTAAGQFGQCDRRMATRFRQLPICDARRFLRSWAPHLRLRSREGRCASLWDPIRAAAGDQSGEFGLLLRRRMAAARCLSRRRAVGRGLTGVAAGAADSYGRLPCSCAHGSLGWAAAQLNAVR